MQGEFSHGDCMTIITIQVLQKVGDQVLPATSQGKQDANLYDNTVENKTNKTFLLKLGSA